MSRDRGDRVASAAVPVVMGLMLVGALAVVSTSSSRADNIEFWGGNGSGTLGALLASSCTLNGASPAKCSIVIPVVPPGVTPICVCSSVGTTAQIAGKGCAVSVVGSTVTITAQNNDTHIENVICF